MPPSPQTGADGVVTVTVLSGGAAVPEAVRLLAVTISRAVDAVPTARLEILDGDLASGAFPASDGGQFSPGAEIRIEAGYGGVTSPLFSGIVVRQGLRIDAAGDPRLVVDCSDRAIAMTLARRNALFVDRTDGEIASALIGGHGGLIADVDATEVTHRALLQYQCSDWDFLRARAAACGHLVFVDDGRVGVKSPTAGGAATLTVTYGADLIAFDATLDATTQSAGVTAVSWDPATQALIAGQPALPVAVGDQGNIGAAALAAAIGADALRLQAPAPTPADALTQWARAQQVRAGLARIQGTMTIQGSALVAVGGLVELKGVSARFNGQVFVTGLTHRIADGNWLTDITFGLPPARACDAPGASAPAAAGLLPAISGVQVGVVKQTDGDPAGEHRVKVEVPVLQAGDGLWARLAQFQASAGSGAFFVPAVGDEVVLGFFDDDPGHPVILGSLYSSKRAPPYPLGADDAVQALVTRGGSRIEFAEADHRITLRTPGGQQVTLDDKGRTLVLADMHGNRMALGSDGIALTSTGAIRLAAAGGIALEATGPIALQSKADVRLSGLNVEAQGQVGFAAKGGAQAELSAAGQTVVRGGIVLIN